MGGSAAVRMVQFGGKEAEEEDIDESAVGSAAVRMVQLDGTEAEDEDMESAVGSAVVRMVDSGMLLSMDLSMSMSMPAAAATSSRSSYLRQASLEPKAEKTTKATKA